MKKILSIDGGGIRGLIPALVLAEIEEKTGKSTAANFDWTVFRRENTASVSTCTDTTRM